MAVEERKRELQELREQLAPLSRGGGWRKVEGLPEPRDFEPWERVLVVVRDTLSGPQNDDIALAYMDYGAPAPGWRDDHGRRIMPSHGFEVLRWMRIPGDA